MAKSNFSSMIAVSIATVICVFLAIGVSLIEGRPKYGSSGKPCISIMKYDGKTFCLADEIPPPILEKAKRDALNGNSEMAMNIASNYEEFYEDNGMMVEWLKIASASKSCLATFKLIGIFEDAGDIYNKNKLRKKYDGMGCAPYDK